MFFMGRKHNVKEIHLRIDDIEGFTNDEYTGCIISWSSDIGFGEYSLYRKVGDTDGDFKLYADSEYMDSNDDKEFISKLMRLVVEKIHVCS